MSTLEDLRERGVLAPLDVHFARAMGRLAGESREPVLLGAALASRAIQGGHVCADLMRFDAASLVGADENAPVGVPLPERNDWIAMLRESPLVTKPGALPPAPLVLDDAGRLYLRRYADYQARLALAIGERLRRPAPVDEALLDAGLLRLFGPADDGDRQRLAAAVALRSSLAVISGGPGTGKTHTVAKILVLLFEQAAARGAELRLALVAPTGKAAQRLGEAIERSLAALPIDASTRDAISVSPSTIHRALGKDPRHETRFRHDGANPLAADLVLVDEASMVDLAMMTKLVEAVPPTARLVLLGDANQLASVEAGAILGDLFDPSAPSMVLLEKSYRYAVDSGIGALARAINAGSSADALAVLESPAHPDAALVSLPDEHALRDAMRTFAREGYRALVSATDPRQKLEALARFRVLSAHRKGPFGVERLNRLIVELLREDGLDVASEWYAGRPIMVTANDYQLDLWNGDIGVIALDSNGAPLVHFPTGADGVRTLPPARLPPHETVFAMTVHKSQGSEFDRVILVLPPKPSPILSRELVYTGVTRAKHHVDVLATPAILSYAIERRVERASGLRDAVWGRGA